MESQLSQGADEGVNLGKVTKCLKNNDGTSIGVTHSNPLLDMQQYEVDFLGGHTNTVLTNVIAENTFAHVDDEGHCQVLCRNLWITRKMVKQSASKTY
mmetsp:Transcript_28406/g.46977  ORF Transcript_28406/g.46977 Transcript_28406/m.46977 type:complete len:98 (-) Transcript_28406:447-740(-)